MYRRIISSIVGLISPTLLVSLEYQSIIKQRELALLRKAIVFLPCAFALIYLKALLLNDGNKTNYEDWLMYRLSAVLICGVVVGVGLALRRSLVGVKVLLLAFGVTVVGILAYGMTLGYSFRSQWMSFFSAPIFTVATLSPLAAIGMLAGALSVFSPIWLSFHEARAVWTEFEYVSFLILGTYFFRKLWIDKAIAEAALSSARLREISQQQELSNQLRSFVPPVLVSKIESGCRLTGSVIASLDNVLRLKSAYVAVLYSDLRDYSRRSNDLVYVRDVVIPSASRLVNLVENNEGIARLIGDGFFAFYWLDDAEEALIRAVRDAWLAADAEFEEVSRLNGGGQFKRYFTVTFGQAYVGNIGSNFHKDTSILGKPANLAARIDGLTKDQKVAKWIGKRPHLLFSHEAKEAFSALAPTIAFESFELDEAGLAIRSYESEKWVHLLPINDSNRGEMAKLLKLNNLAGLGREQRW